MQSQGESAEETHTRPHTAQSATAQAYRQSQKHQRQRELDLLGDIHQAKLRYQIQFKCPHSNQWESWWYRGQPTQSNKLLLAQTNCNTH